MPSLSERLKTLGVQIGGSKLQPSRKDAHFPLEKLFPGSVSTNDYGETFVIERRLSPTDRHGSSPIRFPSEFERIAAWAGDSRLALTPPERFLFLDLESTGMVGSGTFAFLVGVGRFEPDGCFHHMQIFLREPAEELAMLEALNRIVGEGDSLITFNGKSFDIPLLNGRYVSNSIPSPFRHMPHLDLVHLARRLWREMLPSRALGDLEVQLLGIQRTEEDIPGWMIPQMYIDYLHTGDARPMAGVLYHNSMDVISMAALLEHLAAKLAAPLEAGSGHHAELHAIGRLLADIGFAEEAIEVMRSTLAMEIPAEKEYQLVEHLASLFRRRGDYESALRLWERAASDGYVYAHVEIAKYYEHKARDMSRAFGYTQQALELLNHTKTREYERVHWQPLLEYRMARLERKLSKLSS